MRSRTYFVSSPRLQQSEETQENPTATADTYCKLFSSSIFSPKILFFTFVGWYFTVDMEEKLDMVCFHWLHDKNQTSDRGTYSYLEYK